MSQLAQCAYQPVPMTGVDPLLTPLFNHYNSMIERLAELEDQHRNRQQSLENDVRLATRSLMEIQRELVNAERLAAIGEVTANLAHELRNPLAGIEMALSNLRHALSKPDHLARLDLIIDELRRMTRLLNGLLDDARHAPEPLSRVDLQHSIAAVLALVRYQIDGRIRLQSAIPPDLYCRLPEGALRQVLWNLLINAAQSIGDRPGSITVSAERTALGCRIKVSDDGPGLPAQLLQEGVRVFSSQRSRGTGLGLAMVSRFIRGLHGELQLANSNPHGAEISLLLPSEYCYD
jgi:C4-dicarboxylate-specific signal transduction histidine kinase